jgi:hypothetical protein
VCRHHLIRTDSVLSVLVAGACFNGHCRVKTASGFSDSQLCALQCDDLGCRERHCDSGVCAVADNRHDSRATDWSVFEARPVFGALALFVQFTYVRPASGTPSSCLVGDVLLFGWTQDAAMRNSSLTVPTLGTVYHANLWTAARFTSPSSNSNPTANAAHYDAANNVAHSAAANNDANNDANTVSQLRDRQHYRPLRNRPLQRRPRPLRGRQHR